MVRMGHSVQRRRLAPIGLCGTGSHHRRRQRLPGKEGIEVVEHQIAHGAPGFVRAAGDVRLDEYQRLVEQIKVVLARAIVQGGTTLRDFVSENGQSGYFQIELQVYGRSGETCYQCGTMLTQIRQTQRSTWFCSHCQH